MLEYNFPDIFECQVCFGDGFIIMVKYTHNQLMEICKQADTYLLAGYSNRLKCPRCNGTGKSINELQLEPMAIVLSEKED